MCKQNVQAIYRKIAFGGGLVLAGSERCHIVTTRDRCISTLSVDHKPHGKI